MNTPEEDKLMQRNRLRASIQKVLECTEDETFNIIDLMLDDIKLFDEKHKDYGEDNIRKFGEYGVLVRTSDKLERLTTLLNSGTMPRNESISDSWQDLTIYSTIARAVRNGTW